MMRNTTSTNQQAEPRECMAAAAEGAARDRRRDTVVAGVAIGAILAIGAALLATHPTKAYAATEGELVGRLETAQQALDGAKAEKGRLEDEIERSKDRIDEITRTLRKRQERTLDPLKGLVGNLGDDAAALGDDIDGDGDDDGILDPLDPLDAIRDGDGETVSELADEALRHFEDNAERQDELEDASAEVEDMAEEVEDAQARLDRVRNAPPALDGCEPIDWSKSDEEIVAEWAPRIDAYLAGHGLAGHGEDFVRAGIKYGVDPRFAAAISNTESTRGDACFRNFNAFGYMGSNGYNSFTDAIYDISAYLAGPLYHSRLNAQTAQTYCPPTWDSWLANTLSAAQSI